MKNYIEPDYYSAYLVENVSESVLMKRLGVIDYIARAELINHRSVVSMGAESKGAKSEV